MPKGNGTNHLDRIYLEVEIFVFYETIDALCENTLEVALTRTSASVGGHHAGDRGVCSQQGAKFCGSLELGGQYGLEHGKEEVLFATLVLVAIESEHDGLEKGVYFRQADESTEVGDMARL